MLTLTIETLLNLLKKKGVNAELQKETKQIFFGFELNGKQYPIFIRIFEESQLLQIVIFLPIEFEAKSAGETARTLHWINQAIDLPGFGMEESSRTVFYRIMLPALGMRLDEHLLDPFLVAMKGVCETFTPLIQKVAQENLSFEEARKSQRG